jgi:hypothetical protein
MVLMNQDRTGCKNIERLRQLYRDLGLKAEEAALPPHVTP